MLKTEVSNRLDTSVFSISTKPTKILSSQCFSQLKNPMRCVDPCFPAKNEKMKKPEVSKRMDTSGFFWI